MMFNLSKKFALPTPSLKMKNYCNKNCVYEKEQINSSVAVAQFFFYEFYLFVETETICT